MRNPLKFRTVLTYIQRGLAAPVFQDSNLSFQSEMVNLVILAVSGGWIGILLLLSLTRVGIAANILIALVALIIIQALRFFMLRGYVRQVSVVLPGVILIVMVLYMINLGTVASIHLAGLMCVIVIATILLGGVGGALYTAASIAAVSGITWAEAAGVLPPAAVVSPANLVINFIFYSLFLLGTITLTRRSLINALLQARVEVEQRRQAQEATRQLNAKLDQLVADRTEELVQEIENRKQVEKQLRLLSQAVEQSPASVVITDPNGQIEYVNPKFSQVTGYSSNEAIGQNPRILKSGEMPPEGYRQMWNAITSGEEWRGEFHNRRKDGELYWESASLTPVLDPEGKITHFLAVKEDITTRKMMEIALKHNNELLEALHYSTLDFLLQHNIQHLLQSIVDNAAHLLEASKVMFFSLDGKDLVLRAVSPAESKPAGSGENEVCVAVARQVIYADEAVVINPSESSQDQADVVIHPFQAIAGFRISSGSRLTGALCLGRTCPDKPFTPDQVRVGNLFTQIAALAIENGLLSVEMHEQSIRDPLTGLYNRRFLFAQLPRELARAEREGYPTSLALVDIDRFKEVNDQYGHGEGDMVLISLANLLKSMVRQGDILCRYGGDEFIIVMYNTSAPTALDRANQWRQAVETMLFESREHRLRITISIGIAVYPEHGRSIDEVISHADQALYQSKESARNRATLYQG